MIALLAVLSALAGATTDAAPAVATSADVETAPSAAAPLETESVKPELAAPTTATTATTAKPQAAGTLIKRSIAATQWPLEPALSAGFLWSNVAMVPYLGMTTFVPVIPGVGPTVLLRVGAASTGEASYLEGIFGLGVGLEGKLGDLRARVSIVPSVQLSSVDTTGTVNDVTRLGPAVLVPLELGLPLGSGVSFTGTIEPGIAAPVRVAVGNDVVTGRDRFFVLLGVGVTFGGPVD